MAHKNTEDVYPHKCCEMGRLAEGLTMRTSKKYGHFPNNSLFQTPIIERMGLKGEAFSLWALNHTQIGNIKLLVDNEYRSPTYTSL